MTEEPENVFICALNIAKERCIRFPPTPTHGKRTLNSEEKKCNNCHKDLFMYRIYVVATLSIDHSTEALKLDIYFYLL